MCYYIEAIYNLACFFYSYKPVLYALWPQRCYTMQIVPFRVTLELARFSIRKELTAHRIWRDNNLGFLIML